jgi:hypothetical protein
MGLRICRICCEPLEAGESGICEECLDTTEKEPKEDARDTTLRDRESSVGS